MPPLNGSRLRCRLEFDAQVDDGRRFDLGCFHGRGYRYRITIGSPADPIKVIIFGDWCHDSRLFFHFLLDEDHFPTPPRSYVTFFFLNLLYPLMFFLISFTTNKNN